MKNFTLPVIFSLLYQALPSPIQLVKRQVTNLYPIFLGMARSLCCVKLQSPSSRKRVSRIFILGLFPYPRRRILALLLRVFHTYISLVHLGIAVLTSISASLLVSHLFPLRFWVVLYLCNKASATQFPGEYEAGVELSSASSARRFKPILMERVNQREQDEELTTALEKVKWLTEACYTSDLIGSKWVDKGAGIRGA